MIARGKDDMRMIAEHHAFKIEILRRPPHNGEIDGQILKRGDGLLAVAHREPQLNLGMCSAGMPPKPSAQNTSRC